LAVALVATLPPFVQPNLGFNVACIDEWKNAAGGPAPGGTCTNVGCIPSKALLQSSEHFHHANHHFAEHGITVKGVSMDVAKMIARKDTVVKQNNDGILYLFKKEQDQPFSMAVARSSKPRTQATKSRWRVRRKNSLPANKSCDCHRLQRPRFARHTV
jgi:pyruvate/2-oxoglutarate dehydrogenase complex dihydrolipoamide dehydrogenase (E3) component